MTRSVLELLGSRVSRETCVFVSAWSLVLGVLLVAFSFATVDERVTKFGTALMPDFADKYVAGVLLNEYGPDRLYDFELQEKLRRAEFPRSPAGERLPYVYAPWFAYLWRPFAMLSYEQAGLVWLATSAALALAGLACLWRAFPEILPSERWPLALLVLSFEPFLFECWANGQFSSLPFLWLSVALLLERRGRPVAAGALLALLTYKPTQPPLLFALLLLGARWRTLAGVALGGAGLFAVSAALFGPSIVVEYPERLLEFRRMISGTAQLRFWKYTDLQTAAQLLGPPYSTFALVAAAPVAGWMLVSLVRLWRRSTDDWSPATQHAWAATLVLLPVLNLYFAIYDMLLAIPGAVLAVAMLRRAPFATVAAPALPPSFTGALALVWLAGLFTPAFETIRVNLMTLSLLVLGWKVVRLRPAPPAPR